MKKNTADLFEKTSIPKAYFALTVPTVLSKLVMMIYTLADTWFIAATENTALVVAVAMVAGYGATLLSYLWNMIRKCSYCSTSARNLPGSVVHLQPVMSIGIPSALATLLQGFAMTVTNRCLLTYGADPVAAYSIAIKLVSLVYTFQSGFAFGAQPLIGYHYSKEGSGRLKDILKFNYGFMIAVSAVTLAVFWIFAPQLMGMFLSDEKIVLLGADVVRRYALGFIFSGCILVSTTVFRAAGKAREAFILAIGRQGVFYVGILLIANSLFGYTGAVTAQTAADFLTVLLAIILLKKV